MLKQFITESFAFRIKHHRGMRRLILQNQAAQHIEYAVHRSGWLADAIGQWRKRMIRAIKVRRAVNKDKWVFGDLNHDVHACLSNYGLKDATDRDKT